MLGDNLKKIYTCFPGGKHKVLTMSYDDGWGEDRRLVEIFNRHGIRGTFNLNAGALGSPNRVSAKELSALYRGHEIACHAYLHPSIERCPIEQAALQLLADREALEAVTGAPVRGLAYPNGSYNRQIMDLLPMLGIRYGRVVPTTGGFDMPTDFREWKGTCHHNWNLLERGRAFLDLKNTEYLYMMYVWGHSIEFTSHNNWEVMEDFCALMDGRDDIWYATNIEIVDYMDAAGRLQFTVAGDKVYNPNACSVWIEADGRRTEVPGGALAAL